MQQTVTWFESYCGIYYHKQTRASHEVFRDKYSLVLSRFSILEKNLSCFKMHIYQYSSKTECWYHVKINYVY